MNSPRFWSPTARVLGVIALFLTVPIAVGAVAVALRTRTVGTNLVTAAPVVAATIALLSLAVAAASTTANWQRGKRAATIDAWHTWSSDSLAHRKTVTRLIGTGSLTAAQGKALVDETVLPALQEPVSAEEQRSLAEAIRSTLNGLERLAVGVEMGVLDLTTLRRLGGTTITYCFERWEQYVLNRRNAENPAVAFEFAFVELEGLVQRLKSQSLLKRARAIDQAYVTARLRRH
ncbi:DUF4760 domain-containing protein [Cellulomonas sp. KRMCY2]|uniref:DUF4760 domain-containing protein n=1 Tax=Cellulomonas sp. KRMCY2 TaxID=1304865 RepID=UPI000551155F|nr:DUF4760 domain-containing protein [Cellulomonas sp. KRMCY2]